MADVISRLKLDSGEFDSKIKRAGQELMAYSEHCKKMGLEMGYANKDAKDFAKALGSMQTTSSSARGKINELTEAFVNLKVMYKNMTDEEKNNTFGKNLAASLDQLKTRIDQAKTDLNDVNKELGNTKESEQGATSGIQGLTSALGINLKTLTGWGTAIAAGKVALDVAKDAFFASEATVDEWGRVVDSSKSLYEGFLTALNTGDISGYLSRIDEIVSAARTAYDELDRLGTMKTIQAPQMSAQQTENERIRSMIQTGRYIAPIDGRRNAVFNGREMQSGDRLTAGQIRALERQLQNGMQKVVTLVGNEVKQTGKAIDAVYNRQAKELGMDLSEFRKGTSSMAEFDKRMAGYDQYQKWRNENYYTDNWGNRRVKEGNPFEEYRKWGTFRVDGDRYNQLVQLIQQRDQQAAQAYGMQSQAYRTMNRAEGVTVRQIMGGTGGTGGNGGKQELDELQQVQKQINDLIKEAYTADAGRQEQIQLQVASLKEEEARLKNIKDTVLGTTGKPDAILPDNLIISENYDTGVSPGQAFVDKIKSDLAQANIDTEVNQLAQMMTDAFKIGVDEAQLSEVGAELYRKILSGENIPTEVLDELREYIQGNIAPEEKGQKVGGGGDSKKFQENLSKVSSGLSQVSGGLKQIGIEVPQEVDQVIGVINGISQVIQGVQTVISLFSASAMTANTAALIANTAALYVNTAVPGFFAGGGIVGRAASGLLVGNHMSGDNLRLPVVGGGFIGVNDGELILNRAQQGNLAAQLEGGSGLGNLKLEARVDTEEIVFSINQLLRRTSNSEMAKSRN